MCRWSYRLSQGGPPVVSFWALPSACILAQEEALLWSVLEVLPHSWVSVCALQPSSALRSPQPSRQFCCTEPRRPHACSFLQNQHLRLQDSSLSMLFPEAFSPPFSSCLLDAPVPVPSASQVWIRHQSSVPQAASPSRNGAVSMTGLFPRKFLPLSLQNLLSTLCPHLYLGDGSMGQGSGFWPFPLISSCEDQVCSEFGSLWPN